MGQEAGESVEVESQLDALHDRIETALRDSLDEQWAEVLGQWDGASDRQREAVRASVSDLRDRVLDSLSSIESREEIERGLAVGYVEMKCHWTMLNTQIQHQTAHNGRPDEELIYRATCVSLIVQALEPLLTRERVENLTGLLAEPLE